MKRESFGRTIIRAIGLMVVLTAVPMLFTLVRATLANGHIGLEQQWGVYKDQVMNIWNIIRSGGLMSLVKNNIRLYECAATALVVAWLTRSRIIVKKG